MPVARLLSVPFFPFSLLVLVLLRMISNNSVSTSMVRVALFTCSKRYRCSKVYRSHPGRLGTAPYRNLHRPFS